ncbi:MAG: YraN family protein [Agathobacter sp.]|nr:YraN family protein [Agathobacter sp.]
MNQKNKRQTGAAYELRAEEYLIGNGYIILERNFRNRSGEIDLIAKKDGIIRFVEVKYRTTSDFGSPLEAVDVRKQNQIRKVAMYYLMRNKLSEWTPCQFDVIAFEGQKMIHIENAF